MLSVMKCVVMLSVVMLSAVMLSVIMLSVVMLSVIKLSAIMLNVMAPLQQPGLNSVKLFFVKPMTLWFNKLECLYSDPFVAKSRI
jgi:hypothetical protein